MNESRQNSGDEDIAIRDPRVTPEPIDEGKEVVGSDYLHIGMVAEIQGNTLYIAPNTSLPQQIRRKLNWDAHRETNHPISTQFIKEINDGVILTVEWKREQQGDTDGYWNIPPVVGNLRHHSPIAGLVRTHIVETSEDQIG